MKANHHHNRPQHGSIQFKGSQHAGKVCPARVCGSRAAARAWSGPNHPVEASPLHLNLQTFTRSAKRNTIRLGMMVANAQGRWLGIDPHPSVIRRVVDVNDRFLRHDRAGGRAGRWLVPWQTGLTSMAASEHGDLGAPLVTGSSNVVPVKDLRVLAFADCGVRLVSARRSPPTILCAAGGGHGAYAKLK